MMEDWTDIFADGLKDVDAPLPEGDWNDLQNAVQRRRKAAAWRWLGAVASAAAMLVFGFFVFRSEPEELPLYSEDNQDDIYVLQDTLLFEVHEEPIEKADDMMAESPEVRKEAVVSDERHMPDSAETFDVVKDTDTPDTYELIADSSTPAEEDYWDEDDFADDMTRRKMLISMGTSASGGLAGGNVIPRMMSPAPVEPVDTAGYEVRTFSPSEPMTKVHTVAGRILKDTDWQHYLPVSFGVSARFGLTDRLSVNTGLNYTMYASRRTRTYMDGSVEKDMQNVHYLGIPLRCDWKIMDKSNLDMYLGFGGQVEKCIYAKAGSERLHEKKLLWSAGVSLGLQYDVSDRTALFIEPDISWKLNRGTLETYRREHDLMLTARAGFRIDL